MPTIRCVAAIGFLTMSLSLAGVIATPTCVGADKPTWDIVRLRSIAMPPDEVGRSQMAHKVAFSKDGQLLACLCNITTFPGFGEVYLWDVRTGNRVHSVPVMPASDRPVEYFATVPYARICYRTATGLEVQDDLTSSKKRAIKLNLLDSIAEIEQQGVYFSADDNCVAIVRKDDNSVAVWNTQTGQRLGRFALPREGRIEIRSLAFDPTNRYLAAGAVYLVPANPKDNARDAVIIWDLKTGRELLHARDEFSDCVHQVLFSANGELISAESLVGYQPDGQPDDGFGRITIRTGEEFDKARSFYTPCAVQSIAIVPHVGLLTGDFHGQVLLWNIDTGKLMGVAREGGDSVASLAVGQAGKLVVAGDWDSVARLWTIVAQGKRD